MKLYGMKTLLITQNAILKKRGTSTLIRDPNVPGRWGSPAGSCPANPEGGGRVDGMKYDGHERRRGGREPWVVRALAMRQSSASG